MQIVYTIYNALKKWHLAYQSARLWDIGHRLLPPQDHSTLSPSPDDCHI